jgi:hypothetical protein
MLLQVGAELPVDSDDAESENKSENGSTLLFVFERGCVKKTQNYIRPYTSVCGYVALMCYYRDCIGDSSLAGDQRWAGTFGVNLDFVARSHCSVEFISLENMQVCGTLQLT